MIARNPAAKRPSLEHGSWLPYRQPLEAPALRLFAFPYAGGAASAFRGWQEAMPDGVELCAVQLPGRERRMAETPYERMEELLAVLPAVLEPLLDRPFVLFGHSLGAKVAYELARALAADDGPRPRHLIASACHAPHLPTPNPVYQLPDDELVAELAELGGTPPAVLENQELMELFLPLLRADFTLADTYRREAGSPLALPLTVLGGTEDREVSVEELEAWRAHTTGAFRREMFDGGHFFLHEHRDAVLESVRRDLAAYL